MKLARDPAIYTALVAAVVMAVSTFGWNLSDTTQGAINALAVAIAGAWTGWKVSDGQLPLLLGILKAALAVAISFGLHLDDGKQLVIMTLAAAIGAMFVRTQVGAPVPPPASTASPVVPVGGQVTPK
jgi:hypothetical protein